MPIGLPWIFSSMHATYGATEQDARRKVAERVESIDFERGRAQVEDMFGGGVDLSSVKLDETIPSDLIPDVRTVNGRRGRVDIFSRYAAAGYTLRELIIAAGHRPLEHRRHSGADRRRDRGTLQGRSPGRNLPRRPSRRPATRLHRQRPPGRPP